MRYRRAFTLMEMLAVTVLVAILLAAVAQILRSELRQQRSPTDHLSTLASDRLRSDLMNATFYRSAAGGLDLLGPLALDVDQQPLWIEAEVSYRIQRTALGGILVRQQTMRDSSAPQMVCDSLWLGVSSLVVSSGFGESDLLMNSAGLGAIAWRPVPGFFQLELQDLAGRVCFSESLVSVQYD